jgi:phosphoribosyl 1,2-cyclic phosphodiesterase
MNNNQVITLAQVREKGLPALDITCRRCARAGRIPDP